MMISGPTTRRRHPHILRLGVAAVLDVSAVLAVASGVWILGALFKTVALERVSGRVQHLKKFHDTPYAVI